MLTPGRRRLESRRRRWPAAAGARATTDVDRTPTRRQRRVPARRRAASCSRRRCGSARSAATGRDRSSRRRRSSTPTGLTVRQHFATSDDGTRVPYFVVGDPDGGRRARRCSTATAASRSRCTPRYSARHRPRLAGARRHLRGRQHPRRRRVRPALAPGRAEGQPAARVRGLRRRRRGPGRARHHLAARTSASRAAATAAC